MLGLDMLRKQQDWEPRCSEKYAENLYENNATRHIQPNKQVFVKWLISSC